PIAEPAGPSMGFLHHLLITAAENLRPSAVASLERRARLAALRPAPLSSRDRCHRLAGCSAGAVSKGRWTTLPRRSVVEKTPVTIKCHRIVLTKLLVWVGDMPSSAVV